MSYDSPITQTYAFGTNVQEALQFGASGETVAYEFIGPSGRKGIVRDIEIEVTENMVGTTSVPEINVGSAAGTVGTPDFDYARWRLGTTAILGYTTAVNTLRARTQTAPQGDTNGKPVLSDFTGHIDLETDFIPADTLFYVSFIEGVGGTETGAGRAVVTIDWI